MCSLSSKYSQFILAFLLCVSSSVATAQKNNLSRNDVIEDLDYIKDLINQKSSYVYLNGYDFNNDIEHYRKNLKDSTSTTDLGIFLTEMVGKIGDRHSNVRSYKIEDSLYLPYAYAPLHDKVVVLDQNSNKEYKVLSANFPYLKAINGIPINDFLSKIVPKDIKAPKEAYFKNAVRDINAIQRNYILLNKALPNEIKLTLSNDKTDKDSILTVLPIKRKEKIRTWDDIYTTKFRSLKPDAFNNPEIISQLFEIRDKIAYVHIPAMVSDKAAPLLFEKLNSFMQSIKSESNALIIDIRGNGGGTRDLTYEFAKYLISPKNIHIINVTQQRGPIPLPAKLERRLESRRLFPLSQLDRAEQKAVAKFLKKFQPIYDLPKDKYSDYHYGIFNGKKIAKRGDYYNKPVYILTNEKTFSAASVFTAAYKDIPNIKIVGICTDGSSGNNEPFVLPNSKISGRISTMVSFQKNGKTLDTFGTDPDIKIERDIEQILGKRDSQLEELRKIILKKN